MEVMIARAKEANVALTRSSRMTSANVIARYFQAEQLETEVTTRAAELVSTDSLIMRPPDPRSPPQTHAGRPHYIPPRLTTPPSPGVEGP